MRRAILMAGFGAMMSCSPSNDAPLDIAQPAQSITAISTTVDALQLLPLDCGVLEVSDLAIYSSDGAWAGKSGELWSTCWLVRHPDGNLIWELGLPSSLAGQVPVESPPYILSLDQTLTDQISNHGISGKDIDFISFSSGQFNHIGQADQFSDAVWLTPKAEFSDMFPETPEGEEEPEISANSALLGLDRQVFEGEYDVFGDASVVIIPMPGPSPGHTVLQVTLPQSGPILLSGALYHRPESREERQVPQFNADVAATHAAMDAFDARAARLGARVIIPFDGATITALPTRLD